MSPSYEIISLTDKDIGWPFEDSNTPRFMVKDGSYTSNVKVDPFPCYAHRHALVDQEMARVTEAFPIEFITRVYLPAYEGLERTNGWTVIGYDYDAEIPAGKETKPWTATIVLSGKRIPLHPAMTRYLCAHEYGHVVEKWISYQMGEKEYGGNMLPEYAKMRGVAPPSNYGGRTWHASIGEIFANDFRIVVTGTEPEFWPHDVSRPENTPEVIAWWADARNRLAKL